MLAGKIIAVTGSSSGIGAATVDLLKLHGARVIGFDKNIRHPLNTDEFIQVDLADHNSIEAAIALLPGRIDGLCNVAGLPPTFSESLVLQVNFTGLRHFTERMIDQMNDGAAIVNCGSMAGFGWQDNLVQVKSFMALRNLAEVTQFVTDQEIRGAKSYKLSKEALTAWTYKCWDRWQGRAIRMNVVSPGPVETPILKDFIEALGTRSEDDLKSFRAGRSEEIAPMIAFLCSDASGWLRGANIPLDGGLAASALCQKHEL